MFRFLYGPLKMGGVATRPRYREGGSGQGRPTTPETKPEGALKSITANPDNSLPVVNGEQPYRPQRLLSRSARRLQLEWERIGEGHH